MLYNTRKERDEAIVNYFERCLANGLTKTQATEKTRVVFKFLTPVPIYNARRRAKERKEKNNGE